MNNSSAGVRLGPAQIALAASCGYCAARSLRRPRVAILTTGDELVPVDATPGPGKIRNSNAPMLAALVSQMPAANPSSCPPPPTPPKPSTLHSRKPLQADMLLISGGVSAGKYDLVEPALARLGAQFHFTGVKIQPGKPLVFGEIPRSDENRRHAQLFFGLPGNPISSAATFQLFAAPILAALAGSRETHPRFVLAQLARDTDRKAKPGLTRFLPALCTFNPRSASSLRSPPFPGTAPATSPPSPNPTASSSSPKTQAYLEAGSTVRILLH